MEQVLKVAEVAKELKVGEECVRELIHSGKLKKIEALGPKTIRVSREALEDFKAGR